MGTYIVMVPRVHYQGYFDRSRVHLYILLQWDYPFKIPSVFNLLENSTRIFYKIRLEGHFSRGGGNDCRGSEQVDNKLYHICEGHRPFIS